VIWGNLLHLGYNMWGDWEHPDLGPQWGAKPYLRFDEGLWRRLLARMAEAGLNMVVLDLGEGVRYDSHPELAVNGSWSAKKLRRELDRMRAMGLEPIPKLNFSTTHDAWLGEYARCVSTERYYAVCRDLIAEVVERFDRPRFFHLGMDEETAAHQRNFIYVMARQHDLWWHDLQILVDAVEKAGSRAWVWSDVVWHHHDEFLERMPTSVVQSNWYYWLNFHKVRDHRVKAYFELEERGYDQVPTGSIWHSPDNFGRLASYCLARLSPERCLGFLQTPWKPTLPEFEDSHLLAIATVEAAIQAAGALPP